MKTKMLSSLTLLAVVVLAMGCAAGKVNLGESSKVTKGPISLWASWVKDKGRKYDAMFHIGNESDKDMIIMFDDIACWRGNNQGDVKFMVHTGDRLFEVRAGHKKNLTLTCDYGSKATGAFIFAIKHAYENPSGDGVTRGKVLVSDVEWRVNMLK